MSGERESPNKRINKFALNYASFTILVINKFIQYTLNIKWNQNIIHHQIVLSDMDPSFSCNQQGRTFAFDDQRRKTPNCLYTSLSLEL